MILKQFKKELGLKRIELESRDDIKNDRQIVRLIYKNFYDIPITREDLQDIDNFIDILKLQIKKGIQTLKDEVE